MHISVLIAFVASVFAPQGTCQIQGRLLCVSYHTQSNSSSVWEYRPDTNTVEGLFRNNHRLVDLAYDAMTNRIYWDDGWDNAFHYSFPPYEYYYTLANNSFHDIEGMYIEPSSRLLYYTDIKRGAIIARHLQSGKEALLLDSGVVAPRDIVVDLPTRKMYWTDWGYKAGVYVAAMDGSNRQMVTTSWEWSNPSGLHLDIPGQSLYVCDYTFSELYQHYISHIIRVSLLDGSAQRLGGYQRTLCYDLEGNSTHLFLTDWTLDSLLAFSKTDLTKHEVLFNVQGSVYGLHYIQNLPLQEDPCARNPCRTNQLCVPSSGNTIQCKCLRGFDGPNCLLARQTETYPAFITFHDRYMRAIIGSPNDYFKVGRFKDFEIEFSSSLSPACAVNVRKQIAYYFDAATSKLQSIDYKQTGSIPSTTVSSTLPKTVSLAWDWQAENFYLAVNDNTRQAVVMLSGNGLWLKPIVSNNLKDIRSVAVNPIRGYLLWCDTGRSALERANTDGSSRSQVATIQGVLHVVIDYTLQMLYVASVKSLYRMREDGTEVKKIKTEFFSSFISIDFHSHHLAAVKKLIFPDVEEIEVYDMLDENYSRVGRITLSQDNINLIVANHLERQPGNDSQCLVLRCEQFCISTASGKQCACLEGYTATADGRCHASGVPPTTPRLTSLPTKPPARSTTRQTTTPSLHSTTQTTETEPVKCFKEYRNIGCFGQGIPGQSEDLWTQWGSYSYVDADGSAQLPTGVITSVEYQVTRVAAIEFQVFRPENWAVGKMRLIYSVLLRPTRQNVRLTHSGLFLRIRASDRWGFSYAGNEQVPIPYDITVNSNNEPYRGFESTSGAAVGLRTNELVEFGARRVQKQFILRVCTNQEVWNCPGQPNPPVTVSSAPPAPQSTVETEKEKSSGLGTAALAGLGGGAALVIVVLLVLLIICWLRRRRQKPMPRTHELTTIPGFEGFNPHTLPGSEASSSTAPRVPPRDFPGKTGNYSPPPYVQAFGSSE